MLILHRGSISKGRDLLPLTAPLVMFSTRDNIVFKKALLILVYRLPIGCKKKISIVELRKKSIFRKCNNGKYMYNFLIGLQTMMSSSFFGAQGVVAGWCQVLHKGNTWCMLQERGRHGACFNEVSPLRYCGKGVVSTNDSLSTSISIPCHWCLFSTK